jgi:hypothetical protein
MVLGESTDSGHNSGLESLAENVIGPANLAVRLTCPLRFEIRADNGRFLESDLFIRVDPFLSSVILVQRLQAFQLFWERAGLLDYYMVDVEVSLHK